MPTILVYRNLTKQVWSIKRAGCPVSHAKSVTLKDVVFRVRQGVRDRVLREKQKQVHAFVKGTDFGCAEPEFVERWSMVRAGYNPYRNPDEPGSFFLKGTEENITRAAWAMFLADGSLWVCDPVMEVKNSQAVVERWEVKCQ